MNSAIASWAIKLGLFERYQTFDAARIFDPDDFIVPASTVVHGALRINKNVVIFGEVVGDVVVERSDGAASCITVMPGGRVSEGCVQADAVDIRGLVRHARIHARAVSVTGDGVVDGGGDGVIEYLETLTKDPGVAISGKVYARSSYLSSPA